MKKRVKLPADEQPHKDQVIEWWYFNGFLKGKREYAFMTCFFKADGTKINLPLLNFPVKNWYFSHTLLYDLKKKNIRKEILPVVLVSDDSFKRKELFVDYHSVFNNSLNYEIARQKHELRIKTGFFDLLLNQKKKPLLEGGSGLLNLGEKKTYYFSYSNLDAEGFVENDKVTGKAWHDKQWSNKGFKKDSWLWFSLQLKNGTEIVCFDYKGKTMATISYPDNHQKTVSAEFKPAGNPWKSKDTGVLYHLRWKIKAGEFIISTKPFLEDCEMNFGAISYWEGPIIAVVNRKKARGFMEQVANKKNFNFLGLVNKAEKEIINELKYLNK